VRQSAADKTSIVSIAAPGVQFGCEDAGTFLTDVDLTRALLGDRAGELHEHRQT
jgi:hypothetical protein